MNFRKVFRCKLGLIECCANDELIVVAAVDVFKEHSRGTVTLSAKGQGICMGGRPVPCRNDKKNILVYAHTMLICKTKQLLTFCFSVFLPQVPSISKTWPCRQKDKKGTRIVHWKITGGQLGGARLGHGGSCPLPLEPPMCVPSPFLEYTCCKLRHSAALDCYQSLLILWMCECWRTIRRSVETLVICENRSLDDSITWSMRTLKKLIR